MKKIVVLCPKDVTFLFRKELISKLIALRFDVVLVSPYGAVINDFRRMGCAYYAINIDRRGTSIIRDLKLVKDYYTLLKKIKPDIVLTFTTKCSVYGGLICRRLKIPYIVNNAGLIVNDKKKILDLILHVLYKTGFAKAHCMMYQNDMECDTLNALLKYKVHYRKIPGSGVNVERFSYCVYPDDCEEIIFNYVARIVKFKGINEFLKCAKRIKSQYPKTRFIVYGEYDDDRYKKIISNYVERGIIEYAGTEKDMLPFIEKAHAVIHASHYEGMTNVVLEHSAMGRICIGADIPGIREGIEEDVTGFLFEVGNTNALIDAVEKFLKLSYAEKVEMGKLARDKMVREFDRNLVTGIYLEEIRKVFDKNERCKET